MRFVLAECEKCKTGFNIKKSYPDIKSVYDIHDICPCCDNPDVWGILPRNHNLPRPPSAWTWRIVRLKKIEGF